MQLDTLCITREKGKKVWLFCFSSVTKWKDWKKYMYKGVNIFCSYAPKDRSLLLELKDHLFILQRQHLVTTWSDMDVVAGENRIEQIDTHLNEADIILFLISPDFISSDVSHKEMQLAMERRNNGELYIVPILLRPADWQNLPVGQLSVLPENQIAISKWGDKDEAFYNVAQGIRKLVEKISANQMLIENAFEKKNAQEGAIVRPSHNLPRLSSEFFGRDRDILRVLRALASRSFIICIEGMGGVGKTTLAIQTALYTLSEPNRKFERVVWISAEDRPDQELWFNEILDTIAREMGAPALIKMSQEQKMLEVEELLRSQKVLVVVDNYETINDKDLSRWIEKKVPEPSKVLITSRTSNWRNVEAIQLRGMEEAEALDLIRNHCRRWELKSLEIASDEALLPLIKVTEGNPKAIELALGLIKRGAMSLEEVVESLYLANDTVEHIFTDLYERSWEKMHTDARNILMVIPFFADSVEREALGFATGLAGLRLGSAVEELVQFMFLEVKRDENVPRPQYHTHPLTRAFGSKHLMNNPEYEHEARKLWYEYYYEIITRSLIKGRSGDLYWDSLVRSGEATLLDKEWPNVRNILEWANIMGQDMILINLTLLLAHYMNRHFYYVERLLYAQKAVEAAERSQRLREAALFRIDTLGWTFIETNRLAEAEQVIKLGLEIAQSIKPITQESIELIALAYVFLARVALQQGKLTIATDFITIVDGDRCRPVIQFRTAMIAGDIAYRQGDIAKAIQHYEKAQSIGGQYGSEGEDEDLAYRMAIAYLANGDMEKAESSFKNLPNLEKYATVTTGAIYAKLEEAYFARARGDTNQAISSIQVALDYLSPTIESHWMLDELRAFQKNLETD